MAVYFLILVGGIVRTTGSGMGCPDWPKCFGSWSPPESVEQLPPNYREIYAAGREKKNIKFAKYLRAIGFEGTAEKIVSGKNVQTETEFNFKKAWIEYANRLVGVVIGFLIVALFWKSLKFIKSYPSIFYLSLISLIIVIFQGWFGSIVVSTNLTTWTITIHMFLALVLVGFLIYILILATPSTDGSIDPANRPLLIACMVTLLLQTLFGTEVRGAIDVLAAMVPRSEWIGGLGMSFWVHRSFSAVVLILHVVLFMKLNKTMTSKALPRALIILILGALLTGVGMAYTGVPAFLQPAHLVLATSAFGVQLFLLFDSIERRTALVKI